jgi:hypothetical protein
VICALKIHCAAMKLEFLDNINDDRKFTDVVKDQIIRLYDFDKFQADKFRQRIQETIIEKGETIDLSTMDFIETINCNLTLSLANIDSGITTCDMTNFACDMTIRGYKRMVKLLEPFCIEESMDYQWLYDIETPIEFLFSPKGTW